MKISIVREENFQINQIPKEVILEKETDHVPNVGDIVKVGHTLNGFEAFSVDKRVFRSKTDKQDDPHAFQEVILLVNEIR
ncbi:hypothetical protein [Roseovarius aestuariivivens]|uniref:hypothetical protein n=1 Tax=Roseovarius aestuariivivens TaxID=1888910 RepID=UPI0010802543|nr:hypothetical protein [Roseovarius aestuariivivens]